MPIREYECDVCGRRFERIQKSSDPPVEVCPTCGGHVHKLISSSAFQFKGSGWYVTDYAKKDTSGEKSAGESKENGAVKEAKETTGSEKDSGTKKDVSSKKETSTTPSSTSSDTSASTSKTKE